jgi:hypothetical protein
MPTAEVARRTTLFVAATILLAAALFYIARGSSSNIADTLPAQLSDAEFWSMINDFSEAGGYFRSDNLLSNESGYQYVIPDLRKTIPAGGVYVGVGPEQNFTYIVGFEPKMAFIVDIRRQNMLEHLIYKALMEMSEDRAEFISRLFSRPRPGSLNARSDAESFVKAFRLAQPSTELFEANTRLILDYLEKKKGFELSSGDEERIRYVYQAFFDSGIDLHYTFLGGYGGFRGMPTYGDLMTESDGRTRNWHFLATEEQYRQVRRMQKANLIVPLVGDFGGPKAIRSIGRYLKEHDAIVREFYTSNVEQYLFQDDEAWKLFYENVATLPVDSSSTFLRYVINGWRFSRRARSLWSPIPEVVRAFDVGRIRGYYDVVEMSQ